jgi:aminoglycoside phosphotransferase
MSGLLEHDPAVPQRDALLDESFVAARLSALLGPVTSCRRTRVKYRVGARLRVVHRIAVGGARYDVAASTFPTPERSARAYEEGLARAVPCGPLRPVAHDRELRTVFWIFPNDRKLPHLGELTAPARGLAEALAPEWAASRLVAYAPEKAATVHCLDGAGSGFAYAKGYAGEDGKRTHRVHAALGEALEDDPHLHVPRALGYSAAHRTLLVEEVDGRPLLADPRAGYLRLGRGLARLHRLAPPDGARFTRADPERLRQAARLIGTVRSDVAALARELAKELSGSLDPHAEAVCLHGDANFRNALVQNGRVALIDLDQVAAGPAAAELGSVLAALHYAGAVGVVPPSAVPDLRRAFLAGYAELRRVPEEATLRRYTAAALLGERALRVVTRVRRAGLTRLPELLLAARELLR